MYVIRYIHALDGYELYHTGTGVDSEDIKDALQMTEAEVKETLDRDFADCFLSTAEKVVHIPHEVLNVTKGNDEP